MTCPPADAPAAAGVALIKQFEGWKLTAYKRPAGIWTIGYGRTDPDVREGLTIAQSQADDLLGKDLQKFVDGVTKCVTVPLNDNQIGALTCFSYNVGLGSFQRSTLLKTLNAGDIVLTSQVPKPYP